MDAIGRLVDPAGDVSKILTNSNITPEQMKGGKTLKSIKEADKDIQKLTESAGVYKKIPFAPSVLFC